MYDLWALAMASSSVCLMQSPVRLKMMNCSLKKLSGILLNIAHILSEKMKMPFLQTVCFYLNVKSLVRLYRALKGYLFNNFNIAFIHKNGYYIVV